MSWQPWRHLMKRTIKDKNGMSLTDILDYSRRSRRDRNEKAWSSPSSAAEDLGVVEILHCIATRDFFLQACREAYCEGCALFILKAVQAGKEGIFSGKMDKEVVRARLDTIYDDFVDQGASYEIPTGCELRYYLEVNARRADRKRTSIPFPLAPVPEEGVESGYTDTTTSKY